MTPTALVDAAFTANTEIAIAPIQIRSEIAQLLAYVAAERPRRVLEIGTSSGGTLYFFAWASASNAWILSLDVREYDRQRRLLFRSFARRRQRVAVCRADSQLPETRALVEAFFAGAPVDFLFVDGDHVYESARRDYELYAPLVRPGGLIAFHDIVDGPEEHVGGVPRLWRELREELDDPRELVESWDQGGYGIGLGRRRA